MNWIKKHKTALLWGLLALGGGLLLYYLYQQGQANAGSQTVPGGVGTVNYNYSTVPAAQASTATTTQATPDTPTAVSDPVYMHPAGIEMPTLNPQVLATRRLAQISVPTLPPQGSFKNLGGNMYQVTAGTNYPVGTIIHIVPGR